MARDLQRLKHDWENHPCLQKYACKDVEQLAEMLEQCHHRLMSDDGLNAGYLYQRQVEMNNKLKKELRECQEQMNSK